MSARERMMGALGNVVYRVMAGAGIARRRRSRVGGAVFCLHNVVDASAGPPAGEASLHVDRRAFEALIDWIAAAYTVVPLGELAGRVAAGRTPSGLAALTFDDAYRGVLRHALPILRARSVPATVFVVTGASADPAPFWWDVLARAGRLDAESRRACLERHRGAREAILAAYDVAGDAAPDDDLLPAGWDDLLRVAGGDIAIGAHTVTHRNLAALAPDEVRWELETSLSEIADRTGTAPELFSYPYGLYTDAVAAAAARAGYRAAVTMRYGLADAACDPLRLPRVNVPAGIRPEALECWAAGLRWRPPS